MKANSNGKNYRSSAVYDDEYYIRRVQQHIRGWLARKRTCNVSCKKIRQQVDDLKAMDRGFTLMIGYAMFLFFFLVSFLLRANVAFSYTVNKGIENFMSDINFNGQLTYADVKTADELEAFLKSFFYASYVGDETVDLCNTCALLSGCAACYPNGTFVGYDGCDYCEPYYGHCVDGTCDDFVASVTPGGVTYTEDSLSTPENCDPYLYGITTSSQNFYLYGSVDASTTSGWIANENHVIGAALIQWSTYKERSCVKSDMDELYSTCYSTTQELTEDICFEVGSVYGSYVTDGCFQYTGDVNVAMLDMGVYNFGLETALCTLKGMQELEVFAAAKQVELSFITLNGQRESTFSLTKLAFTFDLGGNVDIEFQTKNFPLRKWNATQLDLTIFVLLNLFGLYMVAYCVKILWAMFQDFHQTKSDSGFMKHLKKRLKYWLDAWGTIELFSNLFFLMTYLQWIFLLQLTVDISFITDLSTVSSETTEKIITAMDKIERVEEIEDWLNIIFMVSALLGLLKLLKKMTFHKRLALIIDVLVIGAKDLLHYFIIFFVVVTIFCNIGLAFLGPYSDKFVDFRSSFVSLVRIGLGEPGSLYDEFLAYAPVFGVIFMVAYQSLVGLVLLNVLISICVESFAVYKQGLPDNYDTVHFSFLIYIIRMLWIGFTQMLILTNGNYRRVRQEEEKQMKEYLDAEEGSHMKKKVADKLLKFYHVPSIKRRKIFKIMIQESWAEIENQHVSKK
mmetsp:Transcript_36444/g.46417  ORF Transcript_36444/g.46417 Transcript_36444/m.46417 type:complete len:735 (+) Transcript_36444:152-2356(+)